MNNTLAFALIGIMCLVCNKPIAQELGKLYIFPVRWLFGEKKWVVTLQYYCVLWARFTVYSWVLFSIIVVILELLTPV